MNFSILNQIVSVTHKTDNSRTREVGGDGFILEMVDSEGNTKIVFMKTNGVIERVYLRDFTFKVYTKNEQIKIYNDKFYNYMDLPDHLKKS